MVHITEILDTELLRQHIENGLVTERVHESLPLSILNYTPECQFSRAWDDVTKKCRGLIINHETNEVVARPFEKFFNWDEGGSPYPPSGPALRMEKMDGSLGILYPVTERKGCVITTHYRIATRGSLHSEQAEWATKFFNRIYLAQIEAWNDWLDGQEGPEPEFFTPSPGKTYLFEIIYPENRIVVDYGEYEGLVLIDVIDNETGYSDTDEFDDCEWSDKVRRTPVAGFDSGQAQDIPEGDEGFVYLWPTRNFRTKMKSAQYVYLHRLVSNLNEKTIWEQLVAGKTLTDIKKDLPEEFHSFVDTKGKEILDNAMAIFTSVVWEYHEIERGLPEGFSRAEFAKEATKRGKNSKYLFLMLDGKDVYSVCLKAAKPVKVSKTAEQKEAA